MQKSIALLLLICSLACTPHDYRHRIATTHNGHRHIYYCDSIAHDKEGFYFKNSNGSIVRIR